MRPTLVLLLALVPLGCDGGDDAPEPPDAIVVFLIDTLRADHLSVYGYDRPTSPRLEAFAREALVFERCQAQSSWTKPSTASLLTGLYPAEHGAEHALDPILPDAPALAVELRAAGYRTACFAANTFVAGGGMGFDRGFDTFEVYEPTKELGYVRADVLVRDALAWVERQGDAPFFLYVHVMDPHGPYDPPAEWAERFDSGYEGEIDGHFGVASDTTDRKEDLTPDDWRHLIDLYDGEIAWSDACFGELLDGLERLGRRERTAVVVTADHGEEFDDHGGWRHGPQLFQEVLHVPLIVGAPDMPTALVGARTDVLARQIDVFPTLVTLAGARIPARLSGSDLIARALDPPPPDEVLALSEVDQSGMIRRSLVRGDLKMIRTWTPGSEAYLYDLSADPDERDDLYPRAAENVRDLHGWLEAWVLAHTGGCTIRVRNTSDAQVKFRVAVAAEGGLAKVRPLLVEDNPGGWTEDMDGPFEEIELEHEGRSLAGVSWILRTRANDVDALVVTPHDDADALWLAVLADGEPLPNERCFLGRAATHPTGERIWRVDWDDALVRLSPPPAPAPGTEELRVEVWRNPTLDSESIELSPEARAALVRLGYLGDDD